MGKIYKRGDTYWGRYTDSAGNPQRHSLKTKDAAVAKLRLREAELGPPNIPDDPAADVTLEAALAHMLDVVYAGRNAKTLSSYTQKARHLVRLLGATTPIRGLDRKLLQQYRATRLGEGAAETSVHKEFVVLRIALSEQGIDGVVPKTRGSSEPRRRWLTEEDFHAVMAKLQPKRRLWLLLACHTGLRDSELNSLRWEDVDFETGLMLVRGTKTAAAFRQAPMCVTTQAWLEAERPTPAKGLVVKPWRNRRRDVCLAYWKATGVTIPKRVKGKPYSVAGLPRISPNDLRRTFASWLKNRDVDSKAVADLLGHKSTRMVDLVYGHLTTATLQHALAKLPPLPVSLLRPENVRQQSPTESTEGNTSPHDDEPTA